MLAKPKRTQHNMQTFHTVTDGGGYTMSATISEERAKKGDLQMPEKGLEAPMHVTVLGSWCPQGTHLGYFTFSPLPGCCGVVVSSESSLHDVSKISGTGRLFHRLKAEVARKLGYSMMLATTQASNLPEVIGGAKAGWKWSNEFTNTRTGNLLFVGLKKL